MSLTLGQTEVLSVMRDFKHALPDQALVPYAQHAAGLRMSSSGIRSRRAELTRLGLVQAAGTVKTGSGRSAATYRAV